MSKLNRNVCRLVLAAGVIACVGYEEADLNYGVSSVVGYLVSDSLAEENPDQGFPLTSAIWPERQIPVCWMMDAATFSKYSSQRESVRDAVAKSWESASAVRFVGWQQCSSGNNNGISILVSDNGDGAYTWGLGKGLRNRRPGMVLDFEYVNWNTGCKSQKDYCNRVIAVHEFGHALGFAHEQNRPDTPKDICKKEPQGSQGDVLFGSWDLKSVMNYCNPEYNGNGVLSSLDKTMVRQYYGPPSPPTMTFYISPTSIVEGGVTTRYWNSTGADYCTSKTGERKETSGTWVTAPVYSSNTYEISCTGPGGTVTQSAYLNVVPKPPTMTLDVQPRQIKAGQTVTRTWSSQNATHCNAKTGDQLATSGTWPTAPVYASNTYQISCTGPGGTVTKSVDITVVP